MSRATRRTEAQDAPRRPKPALRRLAAVRPRATIETLILIPAAMLILLTMIDFGLIVSARWEMAAAAQEAAQAVARHGASPAEVAETARRRLGADGARLAVTAIDGPVVTVEISRPTRTASVFGFWRLVAPQRLAMRGEARRITPASEAGR